VFVWLKAQTYSALFRGIQQQRELQHLSEMRRRHGNNAATVPAAYNTSPSSTYISDDDEQLDHRRCTDDLDLVHCADLDLIQCRHR